MVIKDKLANEKYKKSHCCITLNRHTNLIELSAIDTQTKIYYLLFKLDLEAG